MERKLNLNAPLLSARRYASPIKGKKVETSQLSRQQSYSRYKVESNLDQVTEPVAVPFYWERIPGTAKKDGAGRMNEPLVHEKASAFPRKHSGKNVNVAKLQEERNARDVDLRTPDVETNLLNDKVRIECQKEELDMKVGMEHEDDDDTYSDAVDTRLLADSVSMSCSASGLSSSDGQTVKSSGNFSVDPQTRDFMMSRFLPAAKAMTLEPAHYTSKKKAAAVDGPRPIKAMIRQDREPPVHQQESHNVPQHTDNLEDEESEDECHRYENSGDISMKGCGLIPQLCFKNSLRILNPIPGMNVRNLVLLPSSNHVEKPSKAAHTRSHSPSPSMRKHLQDDVYKRKAHSGVLSPKLIEADTKLLTYGSNRFTYESDRQSMNRTSSPLRRSAGTSPFRRSGCVSPYPNERPQSLFQGVGLLGIPKEADTSKPNKLSLYVKSNTKLQERSFSNNEKHDFFSVNPAAEKTLYVDTGNMLRKLSGYSSEEVSGGIGSMRNALKASTETSETEETANTESSLHTVRSPNMNDEAQNLEHKLVLSVSPSKHQDNTAKFHQDSKDLVYTDRNIAEKQNAGSDQVTDQDDLEHADKSLVLYDPLATLLPKKPSESWLCRTIPSISNASSKLYCGSTFQSKRHDTVTSSANAKWETIVKSSYLHRDRVRYSEELTPHPSQQSKS